MNPPPFDERDSEAARRALDFYLNPPVRQYNTTDVPLVIAREDLSAEEAIEHAAALLRCAAATALESAEGLKGTLREHLYSIMHLVNMARALLDRSLAEQQKVKLAGENEKKVGGTPEQADRDEQTDGQTNFRA